MQKTSFTVALLILFSALSHAQTVRELLGEVWEVTKADADATRYREWAGFITLNTATGQYGLVNVTPGPWFPVDEDPEMPLPQKPSDIPSNPSPVDTAIYVVAWFHTHCPMTHSSPNDGRPVGPSETDHGVSVSVALPGFVYDYIGVREYNGMMLIPGGHPLHADAMPYPITPPERRPTP